MAWDSTMIKEGKTVDQRVRIVYSRFTNGDTKDGTKYSLGGLYVRKITSYVSNDAFDNILRVFPDALVYDNNNRRIGIEYQKVMPRKCCVTREHMIPGEEVYQHFCLLYDERRLTEDAIKSFVPKLHIAFITGDENKYFSDAHLTKKMPVGWWNTTALDPLDRYRAAGLGDDIWVKDFLNDDMSPRWREE